MVMFFIANWVVDAKCKKAQNQFLNIALFLAYILQNIFTFKLFISFSDFSVYNTP